MGAVLDLESFDNQSADGVKSRPEVAFSYEDGVRDGQMAAEQALHLEQTHLNAKVSEALVDAMFGYQEAQAHFSAGMTGFIEALLESFIPQLLAPALNLRLRQLLVDALDADASRPVVLRLPEGQVEAFRAIISDLDLSQLTIEADPSLGAHAAFFMGNGCETSIDFDALNEAIATHTAVLTTTVKEVS